MSNIFVRGLPDYDEPTIIDEIIRVSRLVNGLTLSIKEFKKHSRISVDVVRRKLGNWQDALTKSGLAEMYGGPLVTEKMKAQNGRGKPDDELLSDLKNVAHLLLKSSVTLDEFNLSSKYCSDVLVRRFGSWDNALKSAGLASHVRPILKEEDLFENILNVWVHFGRQPKYAEMNQIPSTISAGTYERKFGSWIKALFAFEAYTNSSKQRPVQEQLATESKKEISITFNENVKENPAPEKKRQISLSLRYNVLKRDGFKCVKCGRTPAVDRSIELQIDHIVPFSMGGLTSIGNLQTTCSDCNLGKGNRHIG